jgi:hypothetical protein
MLDGLEEKLSREEYNEDDRVWDCGEICFLFDLLKDSIDIGLESGEIGKILNRGYELKIDRNGDNPFVYQFLFHSLSFLKWMHLNGWPIPDELKFTEDDNGRLEYVEDNLKGGDKCPPPETKSEDEQLKDFLRLIKPEIDALIDNYFLYYKQNKTEFEDGQKRKIAAEMVLDEQKQLHHFEYITDSTCFGDIFDQGAFDPDRPGRLKGRLAKNLIIKKFKLGLKNLANNSQEIARILSNL